MFIGALIIGATLLVVAGFAWGYREGHKDGEIVGRLNGIEEALVEQNDRTASMLLFD
jgi:hypothetical protein